MIIYFSGTGNSYNVAKTLGEKTNDKVVSLKKAVNNGDSSITFIFPTYALDIPKNVVEFIEKFEISKNQEVMGISVSGGDNGNSEHTFNKLIEAKGLKVKKFKNIVMTDNSVPAFINRKIDYKSVDVNKEVEEFLAMEYIKKPKYSSLSKLAYNIMYSSGIKKIIRKRVDNDKCVGCEVCSKLCPNDNIKIVNSKAEIGNDCVECFRCIHVCPKQAVYMKKKISKENQYRNKDIDFRELNQ